GADAAGGHQKGIRPLFHDGFALAHGVGVDKLGASVKEHAVHIEKPRRHAGDAAAAGCYAPGNGAHEAVPAAAEDQAVAAARHGRAQRLAGLEKIGMDGVAGCAVYTDDHGIPPKYSKIPGAFPAPASLWAATWGRRLGGVFHTSRCRTTGRT